MIDQLNYTADIWNKIMNDQLNYTADLWNKMIDQHNYTADLRNKMIDQLNYTADFIFQLTRCNKCLLPQIIYMLELTFLHNRI